MYICVLFKHKFKYFLQIKKFPQERFFLPYIQTSSISGTKFLKDVNTIMYNSCYNNIFKKNTSNRNIQIISLPGLKFKLRTHNNIIRYNNCYNNILKKKITSTNYFKYLIANVFFLVI